jgi:hypothetical protein
MDERQPQLHPADRVWKCDARYVLGRLPYRARRVSRLAHSWKVYWAQKYNQ